MSDRHRPVGDEDVLRLPPELRRRLHPRRGGHPGPAVRIDKAAAARLREQRPQPDSLIARILPGAAWVDGARRYLAGEADPVGAAAAALIPWKVASTIPGTAASPSDWVRKGGVWAGADDGAPDERPDGTQRDWTRTSYGGWSRGGGAPESLQNLQRTLVDAWSAEHGVAFAACALAEMSTVAASWADHGKIRFRPGAELWLGREAAQRMRTLLAAADDGDYSVAVEGLAGRRRTVQQKVVASYLIPTREDWLAECQDWLDDHPSGLEWLMVAIGTPERLPKGILAWDDHPMDALVTLADTAGAAALPLFVHGLDGGAAATAEERRRLLRVISLMPYDEAFQVLLDRSADGQAGAALAQAMTRFPARALRLLAAAGATDLLAGHVRAHPELVAAMPAGSRAAVDEDGARVPEAEPDDLPALLVEPPWTRGRAARKPVVIAGLEPPAEQRMAWAPGEREAWSVPPFLSRRNPDPAGTDWEAVADRYRSGELTWIEISELLALGPDEVARPLLAGRDTPDWWWDSSDVPWMKCVVGRFGDDALGFALRAAKADSAACGGLLLPYLDAEVAALAADWLTRKTAARRGAINWFGRHGADAAPMLFPAALGKPGRARRQAEGALRLLAGRLGPAEIVAAARGLGDAAASAIEALVADPLDFLSDRMPVVGDWANPGALPQILLRGRGRALPAEAAGHVLTMLAMSRPGEPYAGVDLVGELCDRRSLAEFSWALFERWESHGAPADDRWALDQLGLLGDDGTVRRLAAAIQVWPGEGGHQKAVRGLDVLAEIGTDLALMHLHGISQRVKFKGLRARAGDKITEIAESRGLTREQLADRTVPDFGLDDDGSMTLDYGPRRFTVGFDEALVPFVAGEDGRRRKALPRPGANDDPDLAPAAYQRFSSMKKVARTASAEQIRRLERAMVARRRWTATEFRELFVAHPLLWHIARRLVWLAEVDGATTAFRVAEDRTFADVHENAFTLPGTASVGIAHPLHLGGDLAAWREALEDYEILQPFAQVERGTHALTDEESRGDVLARFEDVAVSTLRVLSMRHRGWTRDGSGMFLALPVGRSVLLDLDPGLPFGPPEDEPQQRITTVRLTAGPAAPARLGALDPVIASETLADLTWLTAPK
ncbi:DUF4132 domain-containing protein [Actinomadura darangshiensis]|uniref:DUF4132 domain-containing protein n=1 Tax=Actinomadura darangshiensis TaxID=705336 RepID=A0A4R4ZWG4_9ACTN|nr:DUF4132 domain-containing protein [Actinomadura darangshiensis]TDD62429.1 DUF4132 domain-containing protein [Actinomadura darangshiensis]